MRREREIRKYYLYSTEVLTLHLLFPNSEIKQQLGFAGLAKHSYKVSVPGGPSCLNLAYTFLPHQETRFQFFFLPKNGVPSFPFFYLLWCFCNVVLRRCNPIRKNERLALPLCSPNWRVLGTARIWRIPVKQAHEAFRRDNRRKTGFHTILCTCSLSDSAFQYAATRSHPFALPCNGHVWPADEKY